MKTSNLPIDFGAENPETESVPPPQTQAYDNQNHAATSIPHVKCANPQTGDLIKQAELSRRVFLYLIEKYNLSPSVILHSLYLHSGNVDACEAYLSDVSIDSSALWSLDEDHLILTDSDVSEIINERGLEALRERRNFLHQVCEEAIGNWSEISAKLK